MSQELCRAIDEIISIVDVNGVIREGSDVANRFNELDRTIYVEAQSLSPPLGMPGGVESSIGMTNFPGFRTLNGDIVIQLTEPLRRWKTAMLCMRDLAKQSHITEPNGVVSAERKAKKMPIVDALAELAGEEAEPTNPTNDEQAEPTNPTNDEQHEPGSDNGVTLFDLAFLIEEDDAVAKQTVKQWIDNKRIKAKPIGKCPLDARRQLYRLSEILSDVAEFLSLTVREKAKYRQVLTTKLRTPRID